MAESEGAVDAEEVYFAQEDRPGELCESDFTHLTELGITIGGHTNRSAVFTSSDDWRVRRPSIG